MAAEAETFDLRDSIFSVYLAHIESAFRTLESRVAPPIRKTLGNRRFVFRYADQTIHQAIIQKLARSVSGLHAVQLLLEAGLFQEQGAMQRVVDEMQEDVWFLSLAIIYNDLTQRHKQFLEYFWAEEFGDPDDVMASHASRGMIGRGKIRAYIEQCTAPETQARGNAAGRLLTKAYSGFIHGASPHIMDMVYGAVPPRFDVTGQSKPFRYGEFASDALNYFYRGLLAAAVAAKAFGDEPLVEHLSSSAKKLAFQMR